MVRKVVVVANVVAVAGFAAILAHGGVTPKLYGWDLEIVRAGSRAIFAGADPYAQLFADDHAALARFPFAYPPIVAVDVAPLVALPNLVALALLCAFGAVVLALSAKKRALWVTATFPGLAAMFAGQLVWIAIAVFAGAHALLKRDRAFAAGLACSLLAFKPTLLVLVPFALLVMPSRVRSLGGLLAGLAAQIALCFAIAPGALRAYPRAASDFSKYVAEHPGLFDSVTWRSTFSSDALGAIAIAACGITACAWMWRERRDLDVVMSTCVMGTLACAWHCLPYDYALLVLPFVWLELRAPRVAAALAASSWLVLLPKSAHYVVLALYPVALVVLGVWMMRRVVASRR